MGCLSLHYRMEIMNYETYEYSVCEDCLHYWVNDDAPEGAGDDFSAERHGDLARELNGREGHLSCGVEPTDEDPDGSGVRGVQQPRVRAVPVRSGRRPVRFHPVHQGEAK